MYVLVCGTLGNSLSFVLWFPHDFGILNNFTRMFWILHWWRFLEQLMNEIDTLWMKIFVTVFFRCYSWTRLLPSQLNIPWPGRSLVGKYKNASEIWGICVGLRATPPYILILFLHWLIRSFNPSFLSCPFLIVFWLTMLMRKNGGEWVNIINPYHVRPLA